MKNLFFTFTATLVLLCATTSTNAQGWEWARDAVDANGSGGESVVADKWGNVYVAGMFYNSIHFDALTVSSPYSFHVFLAKYDSMGNVKWVRYAKDYVNAWMHVATDSSGMVYLTGTYDTSITFAGVSLSCLGTAIFLVKIDSAGNVVWAKTSGNISADDGTYLPVGIVADRACNIYVAGQFSGNPLLLNSASGKSYTLCPQMFLIKYDSSGNLIWATGEHDTVGTVQVNSLAIDKFDNLYITGECFSTAVFDTIPFASLGQGMFLVKYDTSGHAKWVRGGGHATIHGVSVSADYGQAVATDIIGDVYVTGSYDSSMVFADSTFTMSGQQNFLLKYDSLGNSIWGRTTYGGSGYACGLATDGAGSIYMSGGFFASVRFGGVVLSSSSVGDVFLVKYDSSGNLVWATATVGSSPYGSSNSECAAVDFSGSIYITGAFGNQSSLNFGDAIVICDSPSSAMFLAKYSNTYQAKVAQTTIRSGIELYPNPATDALNLQLIDSNRAKCVDVLDIIGREVLNYPLSNPVPQTLQIRLPLLANGVYFLKVTGADGVDCLRFVVKR